MDKSGECSLTSHRFTVETTGPEAGELTSGPDYNMVCCYRNYLLPRQTGRFYILIILTIEKEPKL